MGTNVQSATFLIAHQMINGDFVVVKVQSCYWHLFLFLFQHFPNKTTLVEVVLHLFIQRVHEDLVNLISLVALEAEHVNEDNRMLIATVKWVKSWN